MTFRFQVDDPVTVDESTSAKKLPRQDYVSILEAAYAAEPDDVRWLTGVLRAAAPVIGRGLGTHAFSFRVSKKGLHVITPVLFNCPAGLGEAMTAAANNLPSGELNTIFTGSSFLFSSLRKGLFDDPAISKVLGPYGIRDQVAVVGHNLNFVGCGMGGLLSRGGVFPRRGLRTLELVSAHLAAAKRLRMKARVRRSESWTDVQAVLGASGKILHAEDDARSKEVRRTLSESGKGMDRSRGRMRRTDPEDAVSHWRALIEGRWSLVERVDRDGKRLLLARRNHSELPEPSALTLIEQQVAGFAALGHSNKFIGYEVGIAPSTVTKHLQLAMRKLRFRSRAELIRLLIGPRS